MRRGYRLLMLGSILLETAAFGRGAPPPGIWANPQRSVHVAFKRCGDAMCGKVVWASAKAIADAERGGADRLVGEELFRDFYEDEPGRWSGEVYIPDIGQSVTGTITQVNPRTLVGEGCVIAGFGCKQQEWRRIK
jgi:uncharacterized protein (DUF2147 family)